MTKMETRVCPECGKHNPIDSRHCSHCAELLFGKPIVDSEEVGPEQVLEKDTYSKPVQEPRIPRNVRPKYNKPKYHKLNMKEFTEFMKILQILALLGWSGYLILGIWGSGVEFCGGVLVTILIVLVVIGGVMLIAGIGPFDSD